MPQQTTDQQRADQFAFWHSRTGHWVYEYRADALRTWSERGINGLPNYTEGAGTLLKSWAESDPLPALAAKWKAEREAA